MSGELITKCVDCDGSLTHIEIIEGKNKCFECLLKDKKGRDAELAVARNTVDRLSGLLVTQGKIEERLSAIETAIQLLTGHILNLQTELLVIKQLISTNDA